MLKIINGELRVVFYVERNAQWLFCAKTKKGKMGECVIKIITQKLTFYSAFHDIIIFYLDNHQLLLGSVINEKLHAFVLFLNPALSSDGQFSSDLWKSWPSKTSNCIFILCVVQHNIMLCGSCLPFSFCNVCRWDTQHQQNPALPPLPTNSLSHSSLQYCHSHTVRSFPASECIGWVKVDTQSWVKFLHNFSAIFQLRSMLTQSACLLPC